MTDTERSSSEEAADMTDEQYLELRHALDEHTDRSKYDPGQDKNVRRMIRSRYRTIYANVERKKRNLIQTENAGLEETIDKINDVFTHVRNTEEAVLDSRVFVLSADLGTQKARNLRLGQDVFNQDEFVSKVKTLGGATTRDEYRVLDWRTIGMRAFRFSNQVQSMDFMYGPLAVEKKQRKQTRQVRIIRNQEDLVEPTQLHVDDMQQQENETSANVNQVYRILDERGPTNLLEFVVNPGSFSQTVENVFYVSFLVRNAVAEVDDSSGQPLISTRAPPTQEETAQGLSKSQLIMSMDMKLWQDIIATYGIQNSIIPTRPRTSSAVSSKRWY